MHIVGIAIIYRSFQCFLLFFFVNCREKDERNSKQIELAWTYVFGLHQNVKKRKTERMYGRWISNTRDCVTIMTTTTTTIKIMHSARRCFSSFHLLVATAQNKDEKNVELIYAHTFRILCIGFNKRISQEVMHLFSIDAFGLWDCHNKNLSNKKWSDNCLF